jgi:hypothetical protein
MGNSQNPLVETFEPPSTTSYFFVFLKKSNKANPTKFKKSYPSQFKLKKALNTEGPLFEKIQKKITSFKPIKATE